jgi:chromosome segregation ATPase/uncharacterized protein YbaR (Trm112 family)
MNESARHFLTSCPSCAAKVRVNRQHDGKAVVCKHCGGTFVAIDASEPSSSSSFNLPAPTPDPPAAADRIAVLCPNCRTGLSVRRVYIGASVKCKHCEHIFPVSDPAPVLSVPSDATNASPQRPDEPAPAIQQAPEPLPPGADQELAARHGALLAERDSLKAELDRASAERDQLHTERESLKAVCDRDSAALAAAQAEVDSVRASLKNVAPAEVGDLVDERERSRAEIGRYRDDLNQMTADLETQTRRVAELEGRLAELASSVTERDSLTRALDDRMAELANLSAERDALTRELQARSAELAGAHGRKEELERTLEEHARELAASGDRYQSISHDREQRSGELAAVRAEELHLRELLKEQSESLDAARAERDALAVELRGHNAALDAARAERDAVTLLIKSEREQREAKLADLCRASEAAEQSHGAERDRQAGELTALRERLEQLQDQHAATDRLLGQFRERNQELLEAHDKTRSDHEAALAAERSEQARLASQLQEAIAASEQMARAADEAPTPPPEGGAGDPESARAEIEALTLRLNELETLNREMAAVLGGMGIRYKAPSLASR